MEPISKNEFDQLRKENDFPGRLEFARKTGNHQMDNFMVKQTILRTARKHLKAKGFADKDLERDMPLMAPPPGWQGMPTTGNVKIFALLIEFTDTLHKNSLSDIHNALFGNPATGFPYESLAAFYTRASYNKLDLSHGATLGWYKYDKKRDKVHKTRAGRERLIKKALRYFNDLGHDFSQYDNDGDGVVDYFMVFWAGADNGWGNFWWGYQTSFSDKCFKLDGVRFGKYSWQWESRPVGSAFNPRVSIHETGHALGLPDLYDYDPNRGPDGGVGGADMMDANQFDHNAYSKWMLDWITPVVIGGGSASLTLNSSGSDPDCCVVLWPHLDSGDLFGEFFIVQNRQPEGNDSSFPGRGLMIWHIDSSLNASGKNFIYDNSYTVHKFVRLMEADGKEQIETLGYFTPDDLYAPGMCFGNNTFPSSKRYNNSSSGIEINNIVQTGTQITATFSVTS
jgi:M6 family metalloprotease-like protein